MKLIKFLFLISFFFFVSIFCKKKNLSPQDSQWAVESLSEVQKICQKLMSCSQNLNLTNQFLKKIIQTQLSEKTCLEKYQKSRLFFISPKQVKIKKDARKCFNYMKSLSCLDLRKKKFDSFKECKIIKKFQKSKD